LNTPLWLACRTTVDYVAACETEPAEPSRRVPSVIKSFKHEI
jgi:hypothetical protein